MQYIFNIILYLNGEIMNRINTFKFHICPVQMYTYIHAIISLVFLKYEKKFHVKVTCFDGENLIAKFDFIS